MLVTLVTSTEKLLPLGRGSSPDERVKIGSEKSGNSHRGSIPWNKGLTKETDGRIRQYGISGSETKRLKTKLKEE